jgi:hypothetical protein
MQQLNSTKRARVTSNAIHLLGSQILHYIRTRYPIQAVWQTTKDIRLFVCLFSRVPPLFPAGHTLPAEFGAEPTEGSHKATRHADGVCFLIPSSRCDQHRDKQKIFV